MLEQFSLCQDYMSVEASTIRFNRVINPGPIVRGS